MLILNKNILTIGGNRLEGGPLTPPEPPGPSDQVTIGTQIWKTENLAIDDGQGGITTNNVGVVNGVDMGTQYYYTWDAAVRVAQTVGNGWRLPTLTDWNTLATYVGGIDVAGTKLKSINGWEDVGGTDDYGFTALPVGFVSRYIGFTEVGRSTRLWTSTEYSSSNIYYANFINANTTMVTGNTVKAESYSIRLVKDT